jgi:predicted NodU family carbamoyl transferase
MSLRLLCETAAKEDNNKKLENYLKGYFDEAKKNLNQDIKTTLSGQNVTEESIVQLLHTGAHNYKSTSNMAQTIALSIIIGKILTLSHGK